MTVDSQEVLSKYSKLLVDNNTVTKPSSSSMVVNGVTVQGGNNLVGKQIQYTRSKKKTPITTQTLPLAFTTLISNQGLNFVGDRDEPEKVFIPEGFELVSIINLQKEGSSISYDAVYKKQTAQKFFKQIGVIPDPSLGFILNPNIQYFDSFPAPVSCTTFLAGDPLTPFSQVPLFSSDDVVFEFGQNIAVVFYGDVPARIQASDPDGQEFIYYISNRDYNNIRENSTSYIRGVSNFGVVDGYIFNENAFLVSDSLNNFRSYNPFLLNSENTGFEVSGGSFTVARSKQDLSTLKKYTLRVSKIVDNQEESFVEIPDLYEEGSSEFIRFERPDFQISDSISKTTFGGGIINIHRDLCVFWKYEYFEVRNFFNGIDGINGGFLPAFFNGYNSSYIKATVGYANIKTKEVIQNYKNIDLRLLSSGREVKSEPIDYPLAWDSVTPSFLPTVFTLRQGRIFNVLQSNLIDYGFWVDYIVGNKESAIFEYSNGIYTENSEVDAKGFITFDDTEYRLYTGGSFEILPRNFFELPIVIGEEGIINYFQNIQTFFDKNPLFFTNSLEFYRPWLQLTEDLIIVVFIGQPIEGEIVEGQIFYITRTVNTSFDDNFTQEEYTVFEKPVDYLLNFKNIVIDL